MKKDMKKIIKDAAKELFLDSGFEKISMRNIAKKIGYSATTIYHHYRNKQDLLNDILGDYNQKYQILQNEILSSEQNSLDKLRLILKLYVEYGIDNTEYYKLLSAYFVQLPSESNMEKNQSFQVMHQLVQDSIDNNVFVADDPTKISLVLWTHIYGLAGLLVNKPDLNWGVKLEFIDYSLDKILQSFYK